MEVMNEMSNDSDLSSDEETLLTDLEALKGFDRGPVPGPVKELRAISDPNDSICLFASGFADIAATTSNLLDLNQLMIHNLQKMQKQVESKLKNNVDEQQRLEVEIRSYQRDFKSDKFASFQKCGMPFFSTPCGWTQKKNDDTLFQESQGCSTPMQHFASVSPWTHASNVKMTKLVLQFDKETKIKRLEERMERVKKRRGGSTSEWSVLQDACNALKLNKNPQLDEKNIDWMRVSVSLGLEFGPTDCEYQWYSILSPSVNQTAWTREETLQLHRVVKAHNYQSWDKIAAELGTNRSPLACCYQFQRTYSRTTGPWTTKQTLKLKETMELVGPSSRLPSHVAMLCVDKSYEQVSAQVKKLQAAALGCRSRKIAALQQAFSSSCLLEDSYFDRNFTRVRRKYLRGIHMLGLRGKTDVALLKSVIKNGPNWEKVVEDVPSMGDAERVHMRYQSLTSFLVEAVGLGKIPLDETHCHIASKLLPVLEMIQEPSVSRYGISLKKNEVVQNLVEVLKPLKPYVFGPRYSSALENNKLRIRNNLSVFSSLLSVNFDTAEIRRRWESYSQITGAFSNDKFDISNMVKTLHGFTAPDYSEIRGRFVMPPNLVTLLGIRTLLLSRSVLHQQSTLPLTKTNGTDMNPDIAEEDRLNFSEAKNLLRERMRTLFFTSLVLSKVSLTNPLPAHALPKKRPKRPASISKKRKRMTHASNSRWKRLKTDSVGNGDPC